MHHETLLYMFQELEHGLKHRPPDWPALPTPASTSVALRPPRAIELPHGEARLGAARDALAFGWDNEFPQQRVGVPAFAVDDRPVTNADFVEFVDAGGYGERRLWRDVDWEWRVRRTLTRPHSWRAPDERPTGDSGPLCVRSLLEDVPFERAAHWPVVVSWAEASAYARWRGARLPSEAEWHRAAEGLAARDQGNVGFRHGSPLPVGSHPEGASASGVLELAGNGWEWTASPFAPFPGFEPTAALPGLLGRLLRRRALRRARRLVGHGRRAPAPELPQLVPAPLPVRLLEVPLRPLAARGEAYPCFAMGQQRSDAVRAPAVRQSPDHEEPP